MKQSIQPAGSWTVMTLIGIGVAITALIVVPMLTADVQAPPLLIALLVCVPLVGLLVWLALAQGRSFINVDRTGVQIQIPIYGRHLDWAQIDVDQISTLDLGRDSPLALRWRTNGVGVPGYKLGWFRSRDKRKVLAVVTQPKVIVIPTLNDFTVMASVDSPLALANAMRKLAGENGRSAGSRH